MVRKVRFLPVMAVSALLLMAPLAMAKGILVEGQTGPNKHDPTIMERCRGAVSMVNDVGFEGLLTTGWNFGTVGGGGETGRFDPKPILQARVELKEGCLNAHFSAIVGSAAMYGTSPITMFQVTLSQSLPTGGWGPPQHMYGHYETPYGIYGPAVMIEAEGDVDTFGSNFFQSIGTGKHDVPPGIYLVEVWWSGGLAGAGGAIGSAFVLKLYQ
jgi:hypothetical protein